MPRKPWLKLSTALCASSTWYATRADNGIEEFIALLVHADDNGHVCKEVVDALPSITRGDSFAKARHKCSKNLALLQQIGTIIHNSDGSVDLPKYKQYQYLQGFRSDLRPAEVGQLPPLKSRAEQSRAELKPPIPPKGEGAEDVLKPFEQDFEEVWQEYPRRSGPNPKKPAYKAYVARRREGISRDDLLTATKNYAAQLTVDGKIGSEYVLMGSTFYGPNERWREHLALYSPPSGKETVQYNQTPVDSLEHWRGKGI